MGELRLFSRDADGTEIWLEKIDDKTMLQHEVFNPDALFELNRTRQNLFDKGDKLSPMHLIADIPPEIYWDLYRKGIVEDRKAFRKWLDDYDNRAVRTNNLMGRK